MALLLVLWVLAVLTVIVAEFCRTMRTEVGIAYNYKEMTQASYSARAGVQMALLQIIRTIAAPSAALTGDSPGEASKIDWRLNTDIPATGPYEGRITIRIDNEGGKVNINLADHMLLRLAVSGLDLTEDEESVIVDSIMDWRDRDGTRRLNGAENEYYRSLATPYVCKNDDFDSISELLLVRGVTSEIFFGKLSERVTVYPSRKTAEKKLGLKPGSTKIAGGFDFNKINVNAAPPDLLLALPEFDEDMVKAIIAYRQEKDLGASNELVSLIGPKAYLPSRSYLDFKLSPYYKVTAFGEIGEGRVKQGVSAVVRVDLKSKEKYYTVQWNANVDDPGRMG
ncbi:MAG: general secretion pathway protein GspK [Deltaproteobacteria bacterium]|nr:general secretion pathway protein GspK [Deltaproteobacteria bacterium]